MSQRWVLDWSFSLLTMSYDGAVAEEMELEMADVVSKRQSESVESVVPGCDLVEQLSSNVDKNRTH